MAGECVVEVPPKLSARVRVLSSIAGNARKNDGLDALATALAASRNEWLAAVDSEAASEVLRLLSPEALMDLVRDHPLLALKTILEGFEAMFRLVTSRPPCETGLTGAPSPPRDPLG